MAYMGFNDRIKLPVTFDADKLYDEVTALSLKEYIYYDVLPLRSPSHIVDPSLPRPAAIADYADGSWTEWMDTPQLEKLPYIQHIIAYFERHCKVTLIRLLRLGPGEVVKEHTDPTLGLEQEKSQIRLTILITPGDALTFYLNDTPVDMQPGECWYMRLSDPHKVVNDANFERISLTLDMPPNEWLVSQLSQPTQHD